MSYSSMRERREALGLSYEDLKSVGYALAERIERGNHYGSHECQGYERLLSWLEGKVAEPASPRCRVKKGAIGFVDVIEAPDDPYAQNHQVWSRVATVDSSGWATIETAVDPVTLRYICDYAASVMLKRALDAKREKVEAIQKAKEALTAAERALAVAQRDWESAREDAGL